MHVTMKFILSEVSGLNACGQTQVLRDVNAPQD